MALHDYITGTDIEFEVTPNPLAAADINLSVAKANAERRERREGIQKKIDKLEAQKKQLQKSLASVRAHSLSGMSDDDVVALAKSRGIRDQDIATWLQARGQMSARKTSAAQTKALEDAAAAEKERTKNELIQSIYDAETSYENAKAKASRPWRLTPGQRRTVLIRSRRNLRSTAKAGKAIRASRNIRKNSRRKRLKFRKTTMLLLKTKERKSS